MTREAIQIPKTQVPLVDKDGQINREWQRQLENLFEVVQKMTEGIDAASGTASGTTTDDEWNAFVNGVKED